MSNTGGRMGFGTKAANPSRLWMPMASQSVSVRIEVGSTIQPIIGRMRHAS